MIVIRRSNWRGKHAKCDSRHSTVKKCSAQTVKRLNHICLGICHPYQLDDSTCHLRAARCLVSFWSHVEYNFLLCFPVALLWDGRYRWFNTVRFYFISGNHRHVFPEDSANQIHLRYFYSKFSNAKRYKVSEFAYQIRQFTGIQSLPGSAFRGCI